MKQSIAVAYQFALISLLEGQFDLSNQFFKKKVTKYK